jgi:hypothetical protein
MGKEACVRGQVRSNKPSYSPLNCQPYRLGGHVPVYYLPRECLAWCRKPEPSSLEERVFWEGAWPSDLADAELAIDFTSVQYLVPIIHCLGSLDYELGRQLWERGGQDMSQCVQL